jgi:putative phosphoesterase
MKMAIISDIHDNLPNLKKCLFWCQENKIEKIICAGDVTNSETLQILSVEFKGEIFLIRGNADIYDEDEIVAYDNIYYGGRFAIFEIAGIKVGVCHEPIFFGEVLSKGDCNIIFYGHTHKPWIEIKKGVQTVNPGTLGGVFTPATFSFWDTTSGQLELKLLNSL